MSETTSRKRSSRVFANRSRQRSRDNRRPNSRKIRSWTRAGIHGRIHVRILEVGIRKMEGVQPMGWETGKLVVLMQGIKVT